MSTRISPRRRRVDKVEEPQLITPRTSIQYKKLQDSSCVTAAAVARFTNPRVLQLVLFKEVNMEVWEVDEKRQRKILSEVLERPVSHCCVLETSKLMFSPQEAESASLHLDHLLVTDGSGGLMVCEWKETVSEVQESGKIEVHLSPELPDSVLPSTPLFSCPLYLPKRASRQSQVLTTEGEQGLASKVVGITLVAMSLYQGMLGVLCVKWISTYPTLLKECGVRPLKPSLTLKFDLHFVPLPSEGIFPGPLVAMNNPYIIRGLAFLAGDVKAGYGAVDLKGRPLLVLLSSQQGFISHSLLLQCMAMDFSTFRLQPGPWEIRNVHPTTALLLPWSYTGNLGAVVGVKSGIPETGLRPGSSVLAVSSVSMMIVEAGGRRASLPLHLDGLPTCWIRLPQNRLVLGDAAGELRVLELSNWEPHIISRIVLANLLPSMRILLHVMQATASGEQHIEDNINIIFAAGEGGDSQIFELIRVTVDSSEGSQWSGKNLVEESSAFLVSLAPVRDVILVKEAIHCPDPFLLLACGNSPASTLRKGSLMAAFCVDAIMKADVRGLPQLLPFHEFWGSAFHTHILASYSTAHVSEVLTINGSKTEDHFMKGLERRRCTLALSAVPGGWFIQITDFSLRVLEIGNSRVLRAEWRLPFPTLDSPRNLRFSGKIHHAALTPEGAVLVSGAAVHSVEMGCFGLPHTIASSDRPHQVSALRLCHVGDSCLHTVARELVVIIAQWTSNSVHILSWPNLEEIVAMDACSAPVLSVALGRYTMNNLLFAGTADGNLVYYKLSDLQRSPSAIGTEEATGSESVSTGESKRMLTKIRNMGKLKANKSILESEQYTLRQGKMIKVGTIITHMEFGCFNGGGGGGISNHNERSSSEIDEECLYIWSERSLVLLPQHLHDLHAAVLHCPSQYTTPLTRLHTEEHPHCLIGATRDGQLLCGHLKSSIQLRWQVLKVEGTAVHVAHHKSSGCIAYTSISSLLRILPSWSDLYRWLQDGVSSTLHIVHEVTMLQLLVVELERNHLPTVLTTLQMPYTLYSENAETVECLLLATQMMDEQKLKGLLLFFDVEVNYSSETRRLGSGSDDEVKYELRLLGLHPTDQPCHSMCMIHAPRKPFTPSPCFMCNLQSLPRDNPLMADILQCLERSGKHWSQCCSYRNCDPEDSQTGLAAHGGSLLALGFEGKVELLHAFVGASEGCMLLVPAVAAALDDPFLPFPGTYEDLDQQSLGSEDVEGKLISATETAAEENAEVQKTPSTLATTWSTSSRINIQNVTSFVTTGEDCVTALIPLSKGALLVVEKLRGMSVFEVSAEGSEYVQRAMHPCQDPLEAVIPLSDNLYLLSTHGYGCLVMERDYPAEAAYQDQEKLRRDLETELMSVQDQVQDGTPRSTILAELQRSSVERLPCLKHVAAASWTSAGFHLLPGALTLESVLLTSESTRSSMLQTIVGVTPTGEIGIISVSRSSPSRCSSRNS